MARELLSQIFIELFIFFFSYSFPADSFLRLLGPPEGVLKFQGHVDGTVITVGAKVGTFCVGEEVETIGDPVVEGELFFFLSKEVQVVTVGEKC